MFRSIFPSGYCIGLLKINVKSYTKFTLRLWDLTNNSLNILNTNICITLKIPILVHKKLKTIRRCFFWLLMEKMWTLVFLVTKVCAKCLDLCRNLVSSDSVCAPKRCRKCSKGVFPLGQSLKVVYLLQNHPVHTSPFLQNTQPYLFSSEITLYILPVFIESSKCYTVRHLKEQDLISVHNVHCSWYT
jgi:hypothetical protein